jgi:thioredoxin-related protein
MSLPTPLFFQHAVVSYHNVASFPLSEYSNFNNHGHKKYNNSMTHPTMQYGVRGIPTLLLFKDGEVVERITGYLPKPKFLDKLEPHLN